MVGIDRKVPYYELFLNLPSNFSISVLCCTEEIIPFMLSNLPDALNDLIFTDGTGKWQFLKVVYALFASSFTIPQSLKQLQIKPSTLVIMSRSRTT